MIGATLTAWPSMITRSAFLPGVIDPVRSAMPATLAPSSVAQLEDLARGDEVGRRRRARRGLVPRAWCRRPRSEAKIACIWVNWSDDAVVATSELSPTGMP